MNINNLIENIEDYNSVCCGQYDEAGEAEALLDRALGALRYYVKESATTISKESTPELVEAVGLCNCKSCTGLDVESYYKE
jgi:hypothetical protein